MIYLQQLMLTFSMANHQQVSVTCPRQSLFAASVKNLGRRGDLRGNHLSSLTAVITDLGAVA